MPPQRKIIRKISECEIQKSIIEYLSVLENQGKVYFIRTNSFAGSFQRANGSVGWIRNNKVGCPDIVCCFKGRFIGLEIKSAKGKLSPAQVAARQLIEKCFGEYYLIYDLDEAIKIFK